MIRIRNWDLALRTWADHVLGLPFAWGDTDCASLALGALAVMYPAPLHPLPAWDTETGALRLLAADPDVVQSTLLAIGAQPIPAGFATTGDLLTSPTTNGEPGLLVVLTHQQALATDRERGVHLVPMPLALSAPETLVWRVPNE